jgi:hypothetical protein
MNALTAQTTPTAPTAPTAPTMTRLMLLVALGCCLAFPAFAQSEWRTQVQVSTGGGGGASLQFAFDGGLNIPSSSTTLSNLLGATGEATSELNSSGYIPTLGVRAVSGSDRAQAVAWGVQQYTNTTGAPIDTALVLQLDGTIVGSNDLEARVYLFQDENFEFFQNSGTMLFESSSVLWPGFEPFANNLGPTGFDIDIKNSAGPVSETRQFDFTVPAGDSFYVWAFMVATADNAGEVDASSTLTASLTNTTGISVASTVGGPSVPGVGPLVSVVWVGLMTMLGVFFIRHRSVVESV